MSKKQCYIIFITAISLNIFLVLIFRSFEIRYFLGVYPLMYISLGYLIYRLKKHLCILNLRKITTN